MTLCFNFRLWILSALTLALLVSCNNKKNKQTAVIETAETGQAKGDSANPDKGIFDISEPEVAPSPDMEQSLLIKDAEGVLCFDVSPVAPVTAVISKNKSGQCNIRFWQIGESKFASECPLPVSFLASEIKWHPRASALFVMGYTGKEYQIRRVEKSNNGWETKPVYSSQHVLKSLVVCPRPLSYYCATGGYYNYRIFFGEAYEKDLFRTVTVTEHGGRFYQVVGPEKSFTDLGKDEDPRFNPPSKMKADWALPVTFNPAGNEFIWQDKKGDLYRAAYDKAWGKSDPLAEHIGPASSISITPNGLGLIRWQKDKPGIGVYLFASRKEELQLGDLSFISQPCSVADGRGVVGLTKTNGQVSLTYKPIQVPLADVVNAWMFAENKEQTELFQKNGGLFRPTSTDQLFKLYETENYLCNSYDRTVPTRPYLVTTDIFWELYGAAYEGLFVIQERYDAIPAFWTFVDGANSFYKKTNNQSAWAPVFATLSDIKDGKVQSAEMKNIEAASGAARSTVLNRDYNYADLKPRGHYSSSTDMQRYFKAFKYFTTAFTGSDEKIKQELNNLPAEIRASAEHWIESYIGFIAGSRTPMVWKGLKNNAPAYCQYPGVGTTIFPLSWGFDNEILYRDVYHENATADKQITGPKGPRLLPTGLDLAAVLGSNLADELLKSDYEQYPPLRKVIDALKQNFRDGGNASKSDNLYDKWLYALSQQWCDTLRAPNGKSNESIWKAKRLQTGLASWATLRHATSLVNETGAAECGEGGFEDMLLRAPRGYVEPDPNTFGAIADLMETSVKYVAKSTEQTQGFDAEKQSLHDGIIKRLKETAGEARLFKSIAEKEKRGEPLTNEEYEKILFIGRVAEHDFLIFKSLSNKDFGLAAPEPMAKVAEVFGDGNISPYLMSAVGNTMEWQNMVPYFGRHEIVKGAVYSYYEFKSQQLLDDKEWREKLKAQEYQPWVKPYITLQDLSYPATTGF